MAIRLETLLRLARTGVAGIGSPQDQPGHAQRSQTVNQSKKGRGKQAPSRPADSALSREVLRGLVDSLPLSALLQATFSSFCRVRSHWGFGASPKVEGQLV